MITLPEDEPMISTFSIAPMLVVVSISETTSASPCLPLMRVPKL